MSNSETFTAEIPRGDSKNEASRPGVPMMMFDWRERKVSYGVAVPDVTSSGSGTAGAGGGVDGPGSSGSDGAGWMLEMKWANTS